VLVDVREFFEFTICPHVPGAWFLPGSKLKLFMGQPLSDEVAELASELSVDLDVPSAVRALRAYCAKAGIILCFCRSGRRSIDAASALAALGCTNAVSVSGGILAWEDAGFEIANGLPAVGAATQPGPRPASGARSIRIAPRSVGRKASIR